MAELEVEHLSLRFGGLTVLEDLSFAVEPAELFAQEQLRSHGGKPPYELLTRSCGPWSATAW